MIVDRRTWNIKLGHDGEALDLIKAEFAALKARDACPPYRIYLSRIGQFSQIAAEYEFENLAAQEKFWAEWRPSTPEFIEHWFGLNRGEIQIEIWDLVERG
jgi:hypothetical protein